jgi:hypothetical protein
VYRELRRQAELAGAGAACGWWHAAGSSDGYFVVELRIVKMYGHIGQMVDGTVTREL